MYLSNAMISDSSLVGVGRMKPNRQMCKDRHWVMVVVVHNYTLRSGDVRSGSTGIVEAL